MMDETEAKRVAVELMRKEIAKLLLRHDQLVEAVIELEKGLED